MTQPNPSTAMARTIVDELVRWGVGYVVISPGSRSAALAIGADARDDMETVVVLDERSAAFHALGRAKSTNQPVALIATSGTAPANYYPAVIEADLALTPLVVLTADRPSELHGIGANQTIDQQHLYGGRVRHFEDIAAPEVGFDGNELWRQQVAQACHAAIGGQGLPGPVQINVAFREPTVPVSDDGRSASSPYPFSIDGKARNEPWLEPTSEPGYPELLTLDSAAKGLVIAGEGRYDGSKLAAIAGSLGWPVLATSLSGLRGSGCVSSYHHLLAAGVPDAFRPEVVVTVGAIGPSSRLEDLVDSASARIRIDPLGRHLDPGLNATAVLKGDPVLALGQLDPIPSEDWVESWESIDSSVRGAINAELDQDACWSGPKTARALNDVGWDVLVVGSSLPIRDVDAHLERSGRVIANRGASGIDGLVSTAMGVASSTARTLALAGDLTLLHDSNGFIADRSVDLVLVVVDNDGGGLFDTIPTARHAPSFERLFTVPHGRDFETLAKFHQLEYVDAKDVPSLRAEAVQRLSEGGVHLIRVSVDRDHDLELRRRLDDLAADAVLSAKP